MSFVWCEEPLLRLFQNMPQHANITPFRLILLAVLRRNALNTAFSSRTFWNYVNRKMFNPKWLSVKARNNHFQTIDGDRNFCGSINIHWDRPLPEKKLGALNLSLNRRIMRGYFFFVRITQIVTRSVSKQHCPNRTWSEKKDDTRVL